MKVLQIDKYFYLKGGAETVFFNTIDLLEEKGHKVIPFCLKSIKNRPSTYDKYFVNYPELSESSTLTKIKKTPAFLYNKESARKLEALILKEKPDIAHIHLLFNGISVSILPILKKYKIPVIMTAHDYRLICPAYTFTNGKQELCEKCKDSKQYWRCITNKCSKGNLANSILLSLDSYFRESLFPPAKLINKFIFVSKFSQNKHIEANEVYAKKSTHLYNFTPIEKEKYIVKEKYLLYFGRISEEKGISTLIKAMRAFPDIHLKIVGTGPLLQELNKDKAENISFLGFKEGLELKNLISKAAFVVVPSEWYENNPLTIIESMTLGTPVIGSDIGGIPELINRNITGYLFSPGSINELTEAIKCAINLNTAEYQQMVEATQEYASNNFSKEAHYSRLMEIYKSTIENYS